jgi:D-arabinose 1-dehydrogenase-like Zn-dependent alcohol dehydrogenase
VSDDVTAVQPGDRVVINPGLSCRQCDYCRAGEHPLCVKFRVLGEHGHGTFADEIVVPATNVRTIPGVVPDASASAFGLAAMTAWRMLVSRAQVKAGDEVLIWGIGGGVAQAALLTPRRAVQGCGSRPGPMTSCSVRSCLVPTNSSITRASMWAARCAHAPASGA